ncbi:MAG: OprD family outer membrane porin, partial [Arenicella sp.]|nr:OprD family outer membrane porin [Arenicella sp.]
MNATVWSLNLVLALSALGLETLAAEPSKTSLAIQASHYDRKFSNQQSNRTQTGLSVLLRHTHSVWGELLTINGAAYHVQRLAATGRAQEDLLTIDGNKIAGFSLLGEASLKLQPTPSFSIEFGRTQHDSLLLKSKTRLLPSTIEGVNLTWQVSKKLSLYAHRFTKWSARANSEFVRFDTELSRSGAIDKLLITGLKTNFRIFKSTSININCEYFEAKNYLRKTALRTRLKQDLANHSSVEFEAAILSSNDSGALFVNGANSRLDSRLDSSNQRLDHNGLGTYLKGTYSIGRHGFGIAVTKIGEPWLEDSFASDHGTTPFPGATFGPEL